MPASSTTFQAEWAPQDAILLAWPHEDTDWAPMLEETRDCFRNIIEAITRFQQAVILLNDESEAFLKDAFSHPEKIHPVVCSTNDTWARDFGPLFVKRNHHHAGLDFKFNGWGLKFAADRDNQVTRYLFNNLIFSKEVDHENHLDFVLEGGSIESDGEGTLLTTSECLLSLNRNDTYARDEIEKVLQDSFGAKRVLWLDHGYLEGDDTDSHVDTLARFCNPGTIAYIKCNDPGDEHFEALQKMEKQLQSFRTSDDRPYKLIPLPMADPAFEDGHRLPATYANFLIINGAVLVPFHGSPKDEIAKETLETVFPDRKVIGIDCRPLIKQHGSLHCVTMQLPKGVVRGLGE